MGIKRRWFMGGTAAIFAAPSIVRASILMPVSVLDPLIINPPDFWMQPSPEDELDIPQWQAGWWNEGVHNRYEAVEEKRVPRMVRDANRGVFIVRPMPPPSLERPDKDRKFFARAGWVKNHRDFEDYRWQPCSL